MTIILNLYQLFAAFTQSLLNWHPVMGNELMMRECVVAQTPWRHRHRLPSSEYPNAPTFPRYQY